MNNGYVPERGDLIWLDFDPQRGHEQAGRRPGVILSPGAYNRRSRLAWICPITSRSKGYPFEVRIDAAGVQGVALADQVRCLDFEARRAQLIGRLEPALLEAIRLRARVLLD